jgi:hypothetical protein
MRGARAAISGLPAMMRSPKILAATFAAGKRYHRHPRARCSYNERVYTVYIYEKLANLADAYCQHVIEPRLNTVVVVVVVE